jgi:CMP-N,N'-diacetyllegionaminic acid synthase
VNTLFLITARGGSKGIPGKNIKKLGGKPLLHYSIDLAREFTDDENICLSTDDVKIRKSAEGYGLSVPFKRPSYLAIDSASSYDVIIHALEWYEKKKKYYERVVLLQPTSPFRLKKDVEKALSEYSDKIDMVVSVNRMKSNPFATFYKEGSSGMIEKLFNKGTGGDRRQDAGNIYELNGAFYVFNVQSLKRGPISDFRKVKKVETSILNSADIDEPIDWQWCEFLMDQKLVKLDHGNKKRK